MKVLFVLHEDEMGGSSRSLLAALPGLQSRGIEPLFWVPSPGRVANELAQRGLQVEGLPRELRYSLRALRQPPGVLARIPSTARWLRGLRALIARETPDVVHANTLLTLPEAVVARRAGVPVVLHVREMLPGGPRGRVAAALARRVPSAVVTVSKAASNRLAAHGVPSRTVYNGIEIPAERTTRPAGPNVVVGTLGTISQRKGHDLFVEVAHRVRVEEPHVRFRLAGPLAPGPDTEWARDLVERGQADGIEWVGPVDAGAELAGLDIYLHPAREDPFPRAILEAMAAGVAVVATAVDGVPEQVDAASGRLVPPGDAGALARAVVDLVRKPAERVRLGAAGRERVAREFTLEGVAAGLASVFAELTPVS